MNEFDPNHLNKDFSDQPITSLSDLAKRMRGPQYRSSLASQDARGFSGAASSLAGLHTDSQMALASGTDVAGSTPGQGARAWEQCAPVPSSSEAMETVEAGKFEPQSLADTQASAAGNLFEDPALQEDSYAWQQNPDHSTYPDEVGAMENMGFPETVADAGQAAYRNQADFAAQARPAHQQGVETNVQWDARAIDQEFADLSPDSREWQAVAWHQEGPVAGHLVNGQLRGSKRADLRAALSFDYAAEDDDHADGYPPRYRPAAPIPGFARTQGDDGQAAHPHEPLDQVQPDLRAAGEALAAERHSQKSASLGYRLHALGGGAWRACRAASLPQMALITGGVAASVVLGLAIWALVSEPSLRDPVYIAAQQGPEKTVPDDPGGMQIANLDVSLLNDDAHEGREIQILNDGRSSAISLTLDRGSQRQGFASLESIDDLIQVEQDQVVQVPGVLVPSQEAASIDQLIELASLETSQSVTANAGSGLSVQPKSAVFDGPPLPRRKEAGHGLDQASSAALTPPASLGPVPQTAPSQMPSAQAPAVSGLAMPAPLQAPAPGTVSAAAPLSKQDDLGALVEEMESDPIWQLMLQEEESRSDGPSGALGEAETPGLRHPEETPAAILSGHIDPQDLQEARVDLEPLWALDGGRHSQASMLGDFANWIVPSAQKVGEQLAQLRADGQGGLVAAPELAPQPEELSATAADDVIVPDGPWAPPLLPGEAIKPYGLQLASYRSLNSARRSWEKFKQKHPSLLQDLVLRVQQVQIAGRGTFYRLQVGPFPNEITALDVCQQLRERGHRSCLVVK